MPSKIRYDQTILMLTMLCTTHITMLLSITHIDKARSFRMTRASSGLGNAINELYEGRGNGWQDRSLEGNAISGKHCYTDTDYSFIRQPAELIQSVIAVWMTAFPFYNMVHFEILQSVFIGYDLVCAPKFLIWYNTKIISVAKGKRTSIR